MEKEKSTKREKIAVMSDKVEDTNPYSRLMALQKMGIVKDYQKVKELSAIVVGVGGIGSVLAEMLVRCGFGKLILYDYDKIELANMNRLFYTPDQIGMTKVEAAKETLEKINPDPIIEAYNCDITKSLEFKDKIKTGSLKNGRVDLVVSCVDNYSARMAINRICNELNQLWMESGVSESAMSGHIQFIIPGETACFACAPPLSVAEHGEDFKVKREGVCAASLPTTMGIVAGLLAQNILKYLLNFGKTTYLQSYNALLNFFSEEELHPNEECYSCGERQREFKSGLIQSRKNELLVKLNESQDKPKVNDKDLDEFKKWGFTVDSNESEINELSKQQQEKHEVKEVIISNIHEKTNSDNKIKTEETNKSVSDLQNELEALFKKSK